MSPTPARKGATRIGDIPTDVLNAMSRGEIQTATLVECLALDQSRLVRAVFPGLSPKALKAVDAACQLGILKRMICIGAVLFDELGETGIERCSALNADMVRGWACFMIGAQPKLALPQRLNAMRPLADDEHFGVREWAWMAIRPHLAQTLNASIAHLAEWAVEPSERLRRFASEALRPRGVWCAHIAALKREPEQALPILFPLRADSSGYVQDSVANWLNDAAKDQSAWVRDLCALWLQGKPADATRRICQRALRNLR
jgi:3-methyladenine DNA glycosylase AlkC